MARGASVEGAPPFAFSRPRRASLEMRARAVSCSVLAPSARATAPERGCRPRQSANRPDSLAAPSPVSLPAPGESACPCEEALRPATALRGTANSIRVSNRMRAFARRSDPPSDPGKTRGARTHSAPRTSPPNSNRGASLLYPGTRNASTGPRRPARDGRFNARIESCARISPPERHTGAFNRPQQRGRPSLSAARGCGTAFPARVSSATQE